MDSSYYLPKEASIEYAFAENYIKTHEYESNEVPAESNLRDSLLRFNFQTYGQLVSRKRVQFSRVLDPRAFSHMKRQGMIERL